MEEGIGIVMVLIYLAFLVFVIASVWKVFEKAGKPGWAVLVPFYNIIVLLEIAKRPGWWLLLMLIPLVNIVFSFIVHIDVAKAFGKDSGFGVGLTLLGFIFYPILAFGDAQYQGGEEATLEDHLVV
jgi:uncharacterized membrane protein YhaH (DUF805 family)